MKVMKSSAILLLLASFVSYTCGLPLPRFYPPSSGPSPQYWELRPASVQFTSNPQSVFSLYLGGRFDPDRSYIQLLMPVKLEETALEDKYLPTIHPFVDLTRITPPQPSSPPAVYDKTPPSLTKPCINATLINETTWNETNCTNSTIKPVVKPIKTLFIQSDGTMLYPVRNAQTPDPNGAYELAYVVHRPAPYVSRSSSYPMIQYMDYNQMKMDSLQRMSFSPAVQIYEPVYIYKPVYPSTSHDYDTYYYIPRNEEVKHSDTETKSTPEQSKDAKDEAIVQDSVIEDTAKMEDLDSVKEQSTVKEEASEIAMANGVVSSKLQQQSLLSSLSSEIQAALEETSNQQESDSTAQKHDTKTTQTEKEVVVKAEEELEKLMNDKSSDNYWEHELKDISNKDLLSAVEIVLQQLDNRLKQ